MLFGFSPFLYCVIYIFVHVIGLQSEKAQSPPQRHLPLGLGNMEKIKYHDIFDQILRYRYRIDTVVLTIGAFTKYLHNEIFDK